MLNIICSGSGSAFLSEYYERRCLETSEGCIDAEGFVTEICNLECEKNYYVCPQDASRKISNCLDETFETRKQCNGTVKECRSNFNVGFVGCHVNNRCGWWQ